MSGLGLSLDVDEKRGLRRVRIAEMKKGLCCTWVQREAIENNTKILAHLASSVGAPISQSNRLPRQVPNSNLAFLFDISTGEGQNLGNY